MRYECRMGYQAALNATAVGEQAPVLPQSTEAVREGRIGFAHLALMASTAESVRQSPTSGAFDETQLLRQAEKHRLGRFRKDCAHARQGAAGAPAGELEFSAAPIAGATVQRLACDAGATRVLLGPDSAVVDVGRARRLPSASTRRGLAARDRGCVWPGCERPASWTSAHHLQHWAQGGNTDMANLVLVCYRHHWKVHEGGWQLVRGDDPAVLAVPASPGYVQPVPGYLPRAREPDTPVA